MNIDPARDPEPADRRQAADGGDREGGLARLRILILDEPTAALTETEIEELFAIMRDLAARGVGMIHISHHLDESTASATGSPSCATASTSPRCRPARGDAAQIIRLMVGRELTQQPRPASVSTRPVALKVTDLTRGRDRSRLASRCTGARSSASPGWSARADRGGPRHLRHRPARPGSDRDPRPARRRSIARATRSSTAWASCRRIASSRVWSSPSGWRTTSPSPLRSGSPRRRVSCRRSVASACQPLHRRAAHPHPVAESTAAQPLRGQPAEGGAGEVVVPQARSSSSTSRRGASTSAPRSRSTR